MTLGGHTMPVGWNWTNSMLISVAPARSASAWPSPVYSHEFDVTLYDLPMPPVAITTAGVSNTMNPPAFAPVAERPCDSVAVFDQVGDGALVEHLDASLVVAELGLVLLLQRDDLLLQGADDLQARAVADVRKPRVGVAAEVALADAPVLGAVEQRAIGLQLPHPVGRLLGVQLSHPPVVQELPAAHGVAEMDLPVVLLVGVTHRRGAATLGHHGVGLAEQRLTDHRDLQAAFARLDDRTQTRAAGTDHDDVVLVPFNFSHISSLAFLYLIDE